MRKFTVMIALLLVVALATPAIGASFPDVPSNHWAYEAINTLVAAGVIEGYPDGTYKGQRNLTRYEIAMIVSRVLDNIEEERAAMMDKIDSMEKTEAGLTTEQAQDVTAIVKALMQKNMPEVPEMPEELTDKQADQVVNLIEALTFEYQAELKVLGSDIEDLQMDLDEVEARVAALEAEEPIVSFSGEYSVDFTNVTTDGTGSLPDEGEFYYEDPYDTNSGWYLEQLDSDTNNEALAEGDANYPDWRTSDNEDYYDEDLEFVNTLDLDIAVNKGALSADLDLTASSNYFGEADENGFELDDLSGTVTTPDFTATVEDGQTVTFTDYMFDESTVDGVVVTSDNHTFFVSRTIEEINTGAIDPDGTAGNADDSNADGYFNVVMGDEDDYYYYERPYLRAGADMNFDLMLPVNVMVGYEYSADNTFDALESVDDTDVGVDVSVDEVRKAMVAFATETEFAGMDVTADFATSLLDDYDDDYLFRLGASGQLDMFDVAFNYEKTQNLEANGLFIESDAEDKDGYDLEVGGTLGMVEGSVYYEDYGTAQTTINLAVPAGNLSFGGVAVDGSYELTTADDDSHDEYRQINASTTMAGFDLSYMYDYNADNNIWDPEDDFLDDALDEPTDGDYWYEEEDDDLNLHTFDASYALNEALTVGLTSEFEKGIVDDETDITWEDEFTNTNTLTADYVSGSLTAGLDYELDGPAVAEARYTADMYEAGVEFNFNNDDEADNDTIVDGKIMSPVYTVWGVDVSGEASFERNLDDETNDLGVMVDMSKDFNDKLAMTASMEYGDKEIDVDFAGVKLAAKAGVEYSVTEDITANADYEYIDFEGDEAADGNYTATKATMGVSVAF